MFYPFSTSVFLSLIFKYSPPCRVHDQLLHIKKSQTIVELSSIIKQVRQHKKKKKEL